MALDPTQKALAKKYKLPNNAYWMCHGSPVLTHKYLEEIGRLKKVKIESLETVTCSIPDSYAVVKCTASSDKMTVITFGEASPKNNKNSYPFAMAEKRAVGRAILKLAGLHGHFYEDRFSAKDASDKEENKESLDKEILEAAEKFSDNRKANSFSKKTNSKVVSSLAATDQSLGSGWDSMKVVQQVQVFSSELGKATSLDAVNLIGTKYTPWLNTLDEGAKKEVVSSFQNKKKEIMPNG